MLRHVIRGYIRLLKASCRILLSCLSSCRDLFFEAYQSGCTQDILTTLEDIYTDATGKAYYGAGAAVGTAEGLWLVAGQVLFPWSHKTINSLESAAALEYPPICLL